jgi:threonine aldolase
VFSVADAAAFCARLAQDGVLMGALDARRVRAVTHLDVDDAGIDAALAAAPAAVG